MNTCPNCDAPGLGAVTVTAAVPLLPSLVGVIVPGPGATPVTRPLPFTVATAASELDQVTVRPVRAFPLASWRVALNCAIWPTCTEATAGLPAPEATGTWITVTAAVSASQPPLCLALTREVPGTNP